MLGVGRRVDVYGVPLGAMARAEMPVIINGLRAAGISADMAFGGRGLKGAMKGADRARARFALLLGEEELSQGSVAVRDLDARAQTSVPREGLVEFLAGQL